MHDDGVHGWRLRLSRRRPGGRGRSGANAPPPQPMSTVRTGQVAHCEPSFTIPATARVTSRTGTGKARRDAIPSTADAPFGLPMRPTPFYVQITLAMPGGEEVVDGLPVQHRYEGDMFSGEKRTELLVVPALSVRMSPQVAIIPAASIRAARPAAGKGTTHGASGLRSGAALGRPGGSGHGRQRHGWARRHRRCAWRCRAAGAPRRPRSRHVRARRRITDRALRRQAVAERGERRVPHSRDCDRRTGRRSIAGFEVIEYPHIRRYHIYDSAAATLKVIDVRTPAEPEVGYVMGVGDQVPPAHRTARREGRDDQPDDLAWGDLSRFDAIVTGVRAYERRADLRANNQRLLDYVSKRRHGDRPVQQVRVQRRAVRPVSREGRLEPRHRRERAMKLIEPPSPLLDASQRDRRGGVAELGPGARTVFPGGRQGLALPRRAGIRRRLHVQQGAEDGRAGRDYLRQRPLGLRRAWLVAAAAIGHGWRVSVAGEPDLTREEMMPAASRSAGLSASARQRSRASYGETRRSAKARRRAGLPTAAGQP